MVDKMNETQLKLAIQMTLKNTVIKKKSNI